MRCTNCKGTLKSKDEYGRPTGIVLECQCCGYFLNECRCKAKFGYTPERIVHCLGCDKYNILNIDTTRKNWRRLKIDSKTREVTKQW